MYKKITILALSLMVSVNALALTDSEMGLLRVDTVKSTTTPYTNPIHPSSSRRLDQYYLFGQTGSASQNRAANRFCIMKGAMGAAVATPDTNVIPSTKSIGDNKDCITNPSFPSQAGCKGFTFIKCTNSCNAGFVNTKISSGENSGRYTCIDRRYYRVGREGKSLFSVNMPSLSIGQTQCPSGWALEYSSGKVVCSNTNTKRYVSVFPSGGTHPNPVVGSLDRAGNEQECMSADSEMIKNTGTSNNYAYCRKLK